MAVLAVTLLGTACAVPSPHPVVTPSSQPAATKSVDTIRRAPASPSAQPDRDGLASELDIGFVDEASAGAIGEFASTGTAIVYSSNLADDADPDATPDLWRVVPDSVDPGPHLVWRNPNRDHVLTRISGDLDTIAFVDMPITGEAAWDLWLLPHAEEPVLLDSHPGDLEVSALVPSIAVYEPAIAWTAFDIGPSGPVSQLLTASAPDWTPRVLQERLAAHAELWLPSLYGNTVVYTEVVYAPDRQSDERHVYLADISDPTVEPRRLDTSGLATMPQIEGSVVVWKEADRGFNMFNWGRLMRFDLRTDTVGPMRLGMHEYVNYPSLGSRFVAWWGSDTSDFSLYDLGRGVARSIERHPPDGTAAVLRAHVAGDLVAWLSVDGEPGRGSASWQLRFATLPNIRELDR